MKNVRTLNMVFNKNPTGYTTPRAIIPKSITDDMGINQNEREFTLEYDPYKKIIIITKTTAKEG